MATERSSQDADTITYDSCRLCGGRDLETLPVPFRWAGRSSFDSVRGKIGLEQCGDCGFVFTNPRPSDAVLTAHYSSDNYSTHDDASHSVSSNHGAIEIVKRYLPMGGESKFLDYGCGVGHLLYAAQHAGWRAWGFDLGDRAVAVCRSLGLTATTDLDEIKSRRYDAIFLSHVFEHIAEHSELLDELKDMLEPGGAVFIDVPNISGLRARLAHPVLSRKLRFDERYRAFPAHLSYFTPKTLRQMLESRGWEVDDIVNAGMGLDELIIRDESRESASRASGVESTPSSSNREPGLMARAKTVAKSAIRRAYFSLDLGENILAVTRPR